LSGFILTYNYAEVFRSGVSATTYTRFVWDRFTKIYPVHFATLLMVLPVAIFSPNLPLDWRAVPIHALMLQCFWPPLTQPGFHDYLNVPSWSISCEWFFYLIAPIAIFMALGSTARRFAIVAAVAAYGVGLGWFLMCQSDLARLNLVSWFAPSRFPEFLAGVFSGTAFLKSRRFDTEWSSRLARGIGIVLILVGGMYRRDAPWPLWGGLLYVPGSVLLVYGLAIGRGSLAAHLGSPLLHRLGTASFSFYLVHAPILRAAKGISLHFGWEVHSMEAFWTLVVGLFVLVQLIAFTMCYGYEIPLQNWLRGLMRMSSRPGPDSRLREGLAGV